MIDTAYKENGEIGMGLSSCVSLPEAPLGLKPIGALRVRI
jgi:hypothetical protein